ncbi:MAG: hypothetical protein ISS16_08750 [Ignavibacteria bacterium]|nr:hypothetical protein [Ignavibacteria bacterium]
MKRLLITLILTFLFAENIYSQDSSKSNEIGIYFTSTTKFGLRFKFGSENMMFRITALSLNYHTSELELQEENEETKYTGFGLGLGLEVPVSITKHFDFLYGGEIMLEYSYIESHSTEHHSTSKNYEWSAGVILGFAYKINQDFVVSAELIPKFYHEYGESSYSTSYKSYGFKLDAKSAGITVGYRF